MWALDTIEKELIRTQPINLKGVNTTWGSIVKKVGSRRTLSSEMLFRQKELLRWLGVSVFEIWVWLLSLTIFSVLLVLKVERNTLIHIFRHSSGRKRSFALRDFLVPGLLASFHLWWAQRLLLHNCLHSSISGQVGGYIHCSLQWIKDSTRLLPIDNQVRTDSLYLNTSFLIREFRNALLRALWSLFVIGDA